jgi:hypothetical protein
MFIDPHIAAMLLKWSRWLLPLILGAVLQLIFMDAARGQVHEGPFPTLSTAFVVITRVMPNNKLELTTEEFKNVKCRALTKILVLGLIAQTEQVAGRGRVIKAAQIKDWSYTCKDFDPGQNS